MPPYPGVPPLEFPPELQSGVSAEIKIPVLRKWVPSAKVGTLQTGLAPGKIILAPGNF